MFSGIAAGILSVLFMCGSYIFSRSYIRKYSDPVKLSVFSQLVMMAGGLVMLAVSLIFFSLPRDLRFFLLAAGQVVTFLIGQTSFFMMLKHVEATRASSLLGLKLLALVVITTVCGEKLSMMQWIAVLLCTTAAVGMNFSGSRIRWSSFFWLLSAVFFYALCDICITKMMRMMPGDSMLVNAFGVLGVSYTALGFAVLPGLFKYPLKKGELGDSVPYGIFYFVSMLFLYTSFGLIGVVFGSIIQAGRGIFSILLGIVLLRAGVEKNEPDVSGKIWLRRSVMAILMLSAMILYTLSVR
ncbi:MAG: EamA family transporter [Lentisphaeria bacterium]|nr:EamA family transporter [Lentisphaeria bacterium]